MREPNPYASPEFGGQSESPKKGSISVSAIRIGAVLALTATPFFYWGFAVYKIPAGGAPHWFQVAFLLSVAMILVGTIIATVGGTALLIDLAMRPWRKNSKRTPHEDASNT